MTAQCGIISMKENLRNFTLNIIELSLSRGLGSGVVTDTLPAEVLSCKSFSMYEVVRLSCISRNRLVLILPGEKHLP